MKKNLPRTWEEDGFIVSRTTAWSAPGCHEGCGVLCYVKDGKLVKVEGDPEHPFNQGRLCPRCVASPDLVNHPDRLKVPLKRDPAKRGDPDAWEQVSWDEAFDLWEREFKRISEEYGAESLQAVVGTGRDIMWESQRLLYSMNSPNVVSYSTGLACWMPRMVAYLLTMGCYCMADCSQLFEDRFEHEEYKVPEAIIIWGNNCVQSSSDGFYGDWIVECQRRGSKTIVIDPRLTWMAARADIWLQCRPAVDTAVAIAMLKTIIDEDLYNHDFVDKWTVGFDELRTELEKYSVDELAEIAWIDPEKLRAAARMYAAGNNSAIQLGLALDMQRHGVSCVQAIICMMAICDNIDVPGGNILTPNPGNVNFFGWGWDLLPEEQQKKLVGYNEYPMIRMGMRLDQSDLALFQAESEKPYPFRGAFYMGCNPLTCMSNDGLERVYKVLDKMEFNVVLDYCMTPTAQTLGDLVLPITMYPEREGMRSFYVNLGAMWPIEGLERNGDVKSDQEIIVEMGRRFNKEIFPWDNEKDMFSAMLEPSGMTYEELREKLWWYPEDVTYRRYENGKLRLDGKPGFPTPTGRIELYSFLADSIDCPPLPYYEEPYESPISTPEMYKEYPIIVMTGTRNIQFFHSEHRQVPKLREIQPDPWVEINDQWGKEQGFREGDWLWIENTRGRIRQRAKLTPIIKHGMANLNSGWWFPEMDPHDDPMYGCWDVNPNIIVEAGHQGPTGFGADVKALLCKIYRCEESEIIH